MTECGTHSCSGIHEVPFEEGNLERDTALFPVELDDHGDQGITKEVKHECTA
jgi:hypothetical protein